MKRQILLAIFLLQLFLPVGARSEVLYSLDFTNQKHGDAQDWFKKNQFKFRLDADELTLSFKDDRLVISNPGDVNGLLYKEVDIKGAKRVRIEWGVNKYPPGIDWENQLYRDAVMLIITFGKEKVTSGSFIVPNLPYFIGLFLAEKEKEGKAYTGSYYKKGGRYICTRCGAPVGETTVTEFNLTEQFKTLFDKRNVPPISAIAIETDSRDITESSEAFIKKIEFLSE